MAVPTAMPQARAGQWWWTAFAEEPSAALWGRCRRPFHAPCLGRGFTNPPLLTLAALRISVVDGPLTRPPPAEWSYAEPSHGFSVPQSPPEAVLLGAA